MTKPAAPTFQPLIGLYEPSAVVQLPDGRFLVVEDEKSHPLSLVSIHADGHVQHSALTAGLLQMFSSFWQLDDLEGLALDNAGWVYAVTSHSRDGDGDSQQDRDKLVRFRVDGNRVVKTSVVGSLKSALTARHPVLAAAARVRDVKASGGLNIEALDISPDQQRLLVGLRSPLQNGHALIATVENPTGLFEVGQAPRISPRLDTLDLAGQGIRSLCHVPSMGGYLVVSGPASREKTDFGLWLWAGQRGAPARRVSVPGLANLARAEGLCLANVGGQQRLLVVSDDGDRAAGRFARYVLLDPAALQVAP